MCVVTPIAGQVAARNPVIAAFLAIARRFFACPVPAHRVGTMALAGEAPIYCARAALAAVAGRQPGLAELWGDLVDPVTNYPDSFHANDVQIRWEVSQLMQRRFA